MPIVSFWNPTGIGQTGTTATMVSVANSIAVRNPHYKILLTQTHFSNLKMNHLFGYFSADCFVLTKSHQKVLKLMLKQKGIPLKFFMVLLKVIKILLEEY